jgi:tRNA(fMet)-specific endonuclease VapC
LKRNSNPLTPVNGSEIALDSNQAIALLNNRAESWIWIQQYSRVLMPVPVIGELLFGALNSGKPDANQRKVETFLAGCTVLQITATTAAVYADVRLSLKRKGTPIPENDVWIAAAAIEHNVPLAASDGHFDKVDGLLVIQRP